MQQIIDIQTTETSEDFPLTLSAPYTDYSIMLNLLKVNFTPYGHYLLVGEPKTAKGWVLDLSAVESDITLLLNKVIPVLVCEGVSFMIPATLSAAKAILEGSMGYPEVGKIVCIYGGLPEHTAHLAKRLIDCTAGIKGPAIPSSHKVRGAVYARYNALTPIVVIDADGGQTVMALDEEGIPQPDLSNIPFELPKKVSWPFGTIAPFKTPTTSKMFRNKYVKGNVLKNDAKGSVIKAFYRTKGLSGQHCIIKEGVKYMTSDAAGRDIQDRLRWQFKIHKEFDGVFPIAKAIDFFYENENAYFVMELIDGAPLSEVINAMHQSSHWVTLSQQDQWRLIGFYIRILVIVEKMHMRGYLHRDLSPRNFIVPSNGSPTYLTAIDLELAYDEKNHTPHPPFALGTAGYMSPEQLQTETPTTAQDIYALGGLMVRVFTGLSPKLFSIHDPEKLYRDMVFLTGRPSLARLIQKCLSLDPAKRPGLPLVIGYIARLSSRIERSNQAPSPAAIPPYNEQDRNSVLKAIACYGTPKLHSPAQIWISRMTKRGKYISNEFLETTYYTGLNTGVAGPIYLLSVAHMSGINIADTIPAYSASLQFLFGMRMQQASPKYTGLYNGSGGLNLAIMKGVHAGIITPNNTLIPTMMDGFRIETEDLTVANGLAGQGISLLQCGDFIGRNWAMPMLQQYADKIISRQQKDGSWIIKSNILPKGEKIYGLGRGIAGIVYFLLQYTELTKDEKILSSALSGLAYLQGEGTTEHGHCTWLTHPKGNIADPWLDFGAAGIILPFIKAYSILGMPEHKNVAESGLRGFNPYLVTPFLSLLNGAAGLGEAYLNAYRAFRTEEWAARASWIERLLVHTGQVQPDGAICWITDNSSIQTGDLGTGSGGPLHFLLRTTNDKIAFPMFN